MSTDKLCHRCKTFYKLPNSNLCGDCKFLIEIEERRDIVETLDIKRLYLLIHTRNKIQKDNAISYKKLKGITLYSDGDLSYQMNILEKLGLVSICKQFVDKKPLTTYSITEKGIQYIEKLTGDILL